MVKNGHFFSFFVQRCRLKDEGKHVYKLPEGMGGGGGSDGHTQGGKERSMVLHNLINIFMCLRVSVCVCLFLIVYVCLCMFVFYCVWLCVFVSSPGM